MADAFDAEYDLIVLGAGAAGMTAALVAAIEGARPLVVCQRRSDSHLNLAS